MIKTELTEMLGVKYTIIQGEMRKRSFETWLKNLLGNERRLTYADTT